VATIISEWVAGSSRNPQACSRYRSRWSRRPSKTPAPFGIVFLQILRRLVAVWRITAILPDRAGRAARHVARARLLVLTDWFADYNFRLIGYSVLWNERNPHSPSSERPQHPPEIPEAQLLVIDVNNQLAFVIVFDVATENVTARHPLVGLF